MKKRFEVVSSLNAYDAAVSGSLIDRCGNRVYTNIAGSIFSGDRYILNPRLDGRIPADGRAQIYPYFNFLGNEERIQIGADGDFDFLHDGTTDYTLEFFADLGVGTFGDPIYNAGAPYATLYDAAPISIISNSAVGAIGEGTVYGSSCGFSLSMVYSVANDTNGLFTLCPVLLRESKYKLGSTDVEKRAINSNIMCMYPNRYARERVLFHSVCDNTSLPYISALERPSRYAGCNVLPGINHYCVIFISGESSAKVCATVAGTFKLVDEYGIGYFNNEISAPPGLYTYINGRLSYFSKHGTIADVLAAIEASKNPLEAEEVYEQYIELFGGLYGQDDNYVDGGKVHFARKKKVSYSDEDTVNKVSYPKSRGSALSIFGGKIGEYINSESLTTLERKLVAIRASKGIVYSASDSISEPLLAETIVPELPPFFAGNEQTTKKRAMPPEAGIVPSGRNTFLRLFESEVDKSEFRLLRAACAGNADEVVFIQDIMDSDGQSVGYTSQPGSSFVLKNVSGTVINIKHIADGRFSFSLSYDNANSGDIFSCPFSVRFATDLGATLNVAFKVTIEIDSDIFRDQSDFSNLGLSTSIRLHNIAPSSGSIFDINKAVSDHLDADAFVESIANMSNGMSYGNTYGGETIYSSQANARIIITNTVIGLNPRTEFQSASLTTVQLIGYMKVDSEDINAVKSRTLAGFYFSVNATIEDYKIPYPVMSPIVGVNSTENSQFISYLISANRQTEPVPGADADVISVDEISFDGQLSTEPTFVPIDGGDVISVITSDDSSDNSGDILFYPCAARRLSVQKSDFFDYKLLSAGLTSDSGTVTLDVSTGPKDINEIIESSVSYSLSSSASTPLAPFTYSPFSSTGVSLPGGLISGNAIIGYDCISISAIVGVPSSLQNSVLLFSDPYLTTLRIGITGDGFPYISIGGYGTDVVYAESATKVLTDTESKIEFVIDGGKSVAIIVDGIVSANVPFTVAVKPLCISYLAMIAPGVNVFLFVAEQTYFPKKTAHYSLPSGWAANMVPGHAVFPANAGVISTPRSDNVKIQIQPVFDGVLCDAKLAGLSWIGDSGFNLNAATGIASLVFSGTNSLVGSLPAGMFGFSVFSVDLCASFSAISDGFIFCRGLWSTLHPVSLRLCSDGELSLSTYWTTCSSGQNNMVDKTSGLGLVTGTEYRIAVVCTRGTSSTRFTIYLNGANVFEKEIASQILLYDESTAFSIFGSGATDSGMVSGTLRYFRVVVGENIYDSPHATNPFLEQAIPLPSTGKRLVKFKHYIGYTSHFDLLSFHDTEIPSCGVVAANGTTVVDGGTVIPFSSGGVATMHPGSGEFTFVDNGAFSEVPDGGSVITTGVAIVSIFGAQAILYIEVEAFKEPASTQNTITVADVVFEWSGESVSGNLLTSCTNQNPNRPLFVLSVNGDTAFEMKQFSGSSGGSFTVSRGGVFLFSGSDALEEEDSTEVLIVVSNGMESSSTFSLRADINSGAPVIPLATYADAQFSYATPQSGLTPSEWNPGDYYFPSYPTDFLGNRVTKYGNSIVSTMTPGSHGVSVLGTKVYYSYYGADPVTLVKPENQPFTIQALCSFTYYGAQICGNHDGSNGYGLKAGIGGKITFTRKKAGSTYSVSTPTGVVTFDGKAYLVEVSVSGDGICRIFVNGDKKIESAIGNGATSTLYPDFGRYNQFYIGYSGDPTYYVLPECYGICIFVLNIMAGPNVMHVDSHPCPTPDSLCPGHNWPGFSTNFIG